MIHLDYVDYLRYEIHRFFLQFVIAFDHMSYIAWLDQISWVDVIEHVVQIGYTGYIYISQKEYYIR